MFLSHDKLIELSNLINLLNPIIFIIPETSVLKILTGPENNWKSPFKDYGLWKLIFYPILSTLNVFYLRMSSILSWVILILMHTCKLGHIAESDGLVPLRSISRQNRFNTFLLTWRVSLHVTLLLFLLRKRSKRSEKCQKKVIFS